MKIAFLGANSQIAKSISPFFVNTIPLSRSLANYGILPQLKLDVIVNCIGKSKPNDVSDKVVKENRDQILKYDDLCIAYLKKNPKTVYIHFSSGNVYSESGGEYRKLKLEIENKHREHSSLSIVDLRLFSFFSRHIDHEGGFLMSNIIKSIISGNTITVDNPELKRDFIHPFDLYQAIYKCIQEKKNKAVDVHSSQPVVIKEILTVLGVKYKQGIITNKRVPDIYLPKYHNEFMPSFSSMQTVMSEFNWAL